VSDVDDPHHGVGLHSVRLNDLAKAGTRYALERWPSWSGWLIADDQPAGRGGIDIGNSPMALRRRAPAGRNPVSTGLPYDLRHVIPTPTTFGR